MKCFQVLVKIDLRSVADLGGAPPGARPPHGPKFSQFHAVFRKIWQNHMLAPPPTGNPGSAPDDGYEMVFRHRAFGFS